MGFLKKFFNSKTHAAPPKPHISDEENFINWMLHYDDDLEIFRRILNKDLDGAIDISTREIMNELKKFPSGESLLDQLSIVGKYYYFTLKPIIEKRKGIYNCPTEIKVVFLSCYSKITILPYFIKYKYHVNLPQDVFDLHAEENIESVKLEENDHIFYKDVPVAATEAEPEYFNLYHIRNFSKALVPCLTPGCLNTPLNHPISPFVAELSYRTKRDPKAISQLQCERCGKISTYNLDLVNRILPLSLCSIPLPDRFLWAVFLTEVKTNDPDYKAYFGERLLVHINTSNGQAWEGELISESQFASSLMLGDILAGRIFNSHYVCETLIRDQRYPLPFKEVPKNSDFGVFFVNLKEDITHLLCANLFCSNPSCAHTFSLTYSEIKNNLDQSEVNAKLIDDGIEVSLMLTCEICGVSMAADSHSFDKLFKI